MSGKGRHAPGLAWPKDWEQEASDLAAALVHWFALNQRDLPWRRSQDPYAIWVSEVMLQQTQVATAIPYYHRFLARFPTISSLAQAHAEDLMKAWEGLGYYRRAGHLQAAAKVVVAQHGGTLPADAGSLRALPGFGPYTSGAVAAIAFALPEAAVDGNVERVLARLGALNMDPKQAAMRALLARMASSLYPRQAPGEVAQALIELGALVCRPQKPDCVRCPVKGHCRALSQNQVEAYPNKAPRAAPKALNWPAAWVQREDGAVLLVQAPEGGVWGALWTPPLVACPPGEDEGDMLMAFLKGQGLVPLGPMGAKVWQTKHRLTHRLLSLSLRPVLVRGAWQGQAVAQWVKPSALLRWAMPKPFQLWARGLEGAVGAPRH